jgi:hypothetical protein
MKHAGFPVQSRTFLPLADRTPVAVGGRRLVFEHPDDRDLLVKVLRPDRIPARVPWRYRFKRYGRLEESMQEIRETIALWAAHGRVPKHVQPVVGFADTDLGFGLCCVAVRDPDGRLAPSVAELVRSGRYDRTAEESVEEFKSWLVDAPVVLRDLHPGNIVVHEPEPGRPTAVLVDGMGERTLVPVNGAIPALNRLRKKRQIAKFESMLDRLFRSAPVSSAMSGVSHAAWIICCMVI